MIQNCSNKFTSNISTFIIDNINELTYDTDAFENINIDSTRRYGLELETNNIFSDKLSFSNNFTFIKAKYTSGDQGTYATDFKGNDIPLVPAYSLDSILKWKESLASPQKVILGVLDDKDFKEIWGSISDLVSELYLVKGKSPRFLDPMVMEKMVNKKALVFDSVPELIQQIQKDLYEKRKKKHEEFTKISMKNDGINRIADLVDKDK